MSFSETHPNSQYHYDASGMYLSSSDSGGHRTAFSPVEFYPEPEGSTPFWSTSHTQLLTDSIPLHAPVPLPPPSSLLYPDAQTGSYPIQDAPSHPGPLLSSYSSQPLLSPVSLLAPFPEPNHPEPAPLQPPVPLDSPPPEPPMNPDNIKVCDGPPVKLPTSSVLLNDQPSTISNFFTHDFGPYEADAGSSTNPSRPTSSAGTSFQLSRPQQPLSQNYAIAYGKYDTKSRVTPRDGGAPGRYFLLFLSLRDAVIKQDHDATTEGLKQCHKHSNESGAVYVRDGGDDVQLLTGHWNTGNYFPSHSP
ncbi:hypothetical protein EV421DRAFT_2022864 [Armillaria borealis]|uniref:Uncharacterized protein n=1 Tax=Armillaria borealis TaxID=47425 RepID=A0AA39J251_9AGAR|nr:hypothetical protein EV421DRAFT_2022864 [Armillaria borealis]